MKQFHLLPFIFGIITGFILLYTFDNKKTSITQYPKINDNQEYKDKNGKSCNPMLVNRLPILENEINKQIKRIENYENSILLNPRSVEALHNLGLAKNRLKEYERRSCLLI